MVSNKIKNILFKILYIFCRKGANRFLTVYKREGSTIVQADAWIKLESSSKQGIYNLIQKFPLDNKERRDLLPPTERERTDDDSKRVLLFFTWKKKLKFTDLEIHENTFCIPKMVILSQKEKNSQYEICIKIFKLNV